MRLFAPPDDPIRSNDRLVHFYVRRFWWTRSVHIAVECRLCNKRREIKDKRLAREYERHELKVRQELQKRQDLASLREVVLGESAVESMLLKSVVANNKRRVIDTTSS
jgi:hypothetical protein